MESALSMPQAGIVMSVTSHIQPWKQEERRRQSFHETHLTRTDFDQQINLSNVGRF